MKSSGPLFFFSSRRGHTRWPRDWSSDVCSSDLLVGQARGVPGRAGAAQRLQPALAPMGVPAADVLAGHAELVGGLGLGVAGGKQLAGLHADAFERLAVARTAGVAAVGGWSHTAILPGHPQSCHRDWR